MMIQLPPGTKIIVPGGTDDEGDDTKPAGDKAKGNAGDKAKGNGGGGGNAPRNNQQQPCQFNCPQWVQCGPACGGQQTVPANYYNGQQSPPQVQPPPASTTVDLDSLPDTAPVNAGMLRAVRKEARVAINKTWDHAEAANVTANAVKKDINEIKPKVNALHARACAQAANEGQASLDALGCPK